MSLQNFCRKPLVKVEPGTTVAQACELMEQNNVGALVVEQTANSGALSVTEMELWE